MKPSPAIQDFEQSFAPPTGLTGASGPSHVAFGFVNREGRHTGAYRVALYRFSTLERPAAMPVGIPQAAESKKSCPAPAMAGNQRLQDAIFFKRLGAVFACVAPKAGSVMGGLAGESQQEARSQ